MKHLQMVYCINSMNLVSICCAFICNETEWKWEFMLHLMFLCYLLPAFFFFSSKFGAVDSTSVFLGLFVKGEVV